MEGHIGSLGKWEVKFEGGKAVCEADASFGASSIGLVVKIDEKQILDALIAKFGPHSVLGEILGAAEAVLPAAQAEAVSPA